MTKRKQEPAKQPEAPPQEAEVPATTETEVIQQPDILTEVTERTQEIQDQRNQLKLDHDLATLMAQAELFNAKVPRDVAVAQAFARIQIGRDMGFSPAQSLDGIYVVNGRPAVASALRATRLRQYGYDWDILEHTATRIILEFKKDGKVMMRRNVKGETEPLREAFTLEDAQRGGYIKDGGGWKKTPKNMLFARCITNFQRWHAPEVLAAHSEILDVEEAEVITPELEEKTKGQADDLKQRLQQAKQVEAPAQDKAPPEGATLFDEPQAAPTKRAKK